MKHLGRRLGVVLLRLLIWLVRIVPMGPALAIGRGLGNLVRLAQPKRYRVALKNLRIAYGDTLAEAERHRIARASFRHFGMFAVESVKFAYIPRSEVEQRIHIEGYDTLSEVLSRKNGAILVTGHLGNFEIAGRWLTGRGHELYALARASRDRGTTDLMLNMRERMGIRVVTLQQSLKPVLLALKRNACLAIICDQNATDIVVPFFGRPTGTVDGPARLSRKFGAPLVSFTCIRDGRGGYNVTVNDVIWPDQAAPEQVEVPRLMTEVNASLERAIRRTPEQWLWFHDRWRSSPPVPEEGDSAQATVSRS